MVDGVHLTIHYLLIKKDLNMTYEEYEKMKLEWERLYLIDNLTLEEEKIFNIISQKLEDYEREKNDWIE